MSRTLQFLGSNSSVLSYAVVVVAVNALRGVRGITAFVKIFGGVKIFEHRVDGLAVITVNLCLSLFDKKTRLRSFIGRGSR